MPIRRIKDAGESGAMNQTLQALEFVTITNPDEIKDPIKQKTIRRQARRRDHGSKSSSWKSFKMIIDLPGGDIHAGHEQSIMGHPKTSSYYIPPTEHERLQLNNEVPSSDFLRSMSISRPSILASHFSLEMKTQVAQLVSFIRHGGDGNFCPLKDFWVSIGQLDLTASLVTLANVKRVMNRGYSFERRENPEAVTLYTKSIQSLQKRIQSPIDAVSEGVIISVLEFAYYDFLAQNLTRWLVHMSGLTNIIRRRGGIHTLYSSNMILLLNFWIDVSGSFIFDSAPFSPPPYHLLTPVANKVTASRILQKWNTAFPELSDITNFLCQAANMASYIDERATNTEIWKDDIFTSKTFNVVVHQLLSLGRHTEVIDGGMSSSQQVMREAMRRACMILFALLRKGFSVHPSGISQHRNGVKELLVQHPIDWSTFLELRLWVLLTASLAAGDDEILWYISEIKCTFVQMGISEWDEGVEVAKSILWMEETFKTRCNSLKDLFQLSVVR